MHSLKPLLAKLSHRFRKPQALIFMILAINTIFALSIVDDFGESWDEEKYLLYGKDTVAVYNHPFSISTTSELGPGNLVYYGPFYVAFSTIVDHGISRLGLDIAQETVFHFMYFVSFQIAVYSLYTINMRFMKTGAAITATLLFASQPLLFGHAFINPKDIPFLGFFLATLATGFWLADSTGEHITRKATPTTMDFTSTLGMDWRSNKQTLRRMGILFLVLIFVALLAFIGRDAIDTTIARLIERAFQAAPQSLLGSAIRIVAENSDRIAVENYAIRGIAIFWSVFYYGYASLIAMVLIGLIRYSPHMRQWAKSQWLIPLMREINREFPLKILRSYQNPRLLAAGAVLGLCTAIRVIGPAGGILVSILLFARWRMDAWARIIAYFSVGAIATYFCWPFLWGAPITRFIESITLMSKFTWDGKVLFDGVLYRASDLPGRYFPQLLSLQFSEPLLILAFAGQLAVIYQMIKKRLEAPAGLVISLWFWVPFIYIQLAHPTLYDNFRQFLFITPPMFVLAGVAMNGIFNKLKSKVLYGLLISAILFPGLYWTVKLHPYQYVYYNFLTGGVEGAYQKYELDYWAVSYKRTMEYINNFAKPNSTIVVWGAPHLAKRYGRDDLSIISNLELLSGMPHDAEYAVVLTKQNRDAEAENIGYVVYQVEIEDAVLAIVKKLN